MKTSSIIKGISLLLPLTLLGAEYIMLPEYDNLANASFSKHEVLISNKSPFYSSKTYNLQGKSLRYRCVTIPKITCANGYSPEVLARLKKAPVLKDSVHKEQIISYQIDIQTEDQGNSFAICGGAVGALSWDYSKYTKKTTSSGTTYTYKYIPLNKQVRYFFFTNISGNAPKIDGIGGGAYSGSDDSYLVADVEQVCR